MIGNIFSRKTFLVTGALGLFIVGRTQVQAALLPANGSWPLVRNWVSSGKVGQRLWIHVDCPSGTDYTGAVAPVLHACALDCPLHVSVLGEPQQDHVLPPRFLMTAQFTDGHTLVLNVSPSVLARTTIRGSRGHIDIGNRRIRFEESSSISALVSLRFVQGTHEKQATSQAVEVLRLAAQTFANR